MFKLITSFVSIFLVLGGANLSIEYKMFLNYITGGGDVTASFFASDEVMDIKEICETKTRRWEKETSYVVSSLTHSQKYALALGDFTCLTNKQGELVGAYDVYDFNYSGKRSNVAGCFFKSTPKRVADCLVVNTPARAYDVNITF